MSPVLAWMLALAPATSPAASAGDRAAEGDAPAVAVRINLGPPLVRRMGLRLTVRRAGDDPVMHRPVDVHDIPPPAYSDDKPPPLRIDLAPGDYLLEADVAGYLPSTRAVTIKAGVAPTPVVWALLPDSAHRTVRFSIVSRQDDAPVSLTARHIEGEQSPVSCTARNAPCEFRLRRGEWEIQASAPGYRPLRQIVSVGEADSQSIDLALQPGLIEQPLPHPPPPAPVPPAGERRKLVLGLSLAAVPLFAAGLPLTIVGPVRYRQLRTSPICDDYGATCADAIIPQIHVGSVGAGMFGAAIGLGITAVTAWKSKGTAPWWVNIGVGGALSLAGTAWLIGNSVLLDRELKTGPLGDIDARTGRRAGSSFILGAGVGLLGGGITGLVLRRQSRLARVSPYGGPGQAGLLLGGSF